MIEWRTKERYYHVWIAPEATQDFFNDDLDKAFFLSLLQDYLSPTRKLARFDSTHASFADDVHLVAFSLTHYGVNLLACSSSAAHLEEFGQTLLRRYIEHLNSRTSLSMLPFHTLFAHDRLKDVREALHISKEIHLLHDDWRYDRYSSIGFYLDDRRGDWIQVWRLCELYQNDTAWYLDFLHEDEPAEPTHFKYLQV